MEAVTLSELKEALHDQNRTGGNLGEILLQKGYVTHEVLARALSKQSGLDFMPLDQTPSENCALDAVSEGIAVKYRLLPTKMQDGKLIVLIESPRDRQALKDVSVLLGMELTPALTATEDIVEEIKSRYHAIKMKKRRPQSLIMSSEERAELADEAAKLRHELESSSKEPEAPESKITEIAEEEPKKERKEPALSATTIGRFRQLAEQVSGMPVVNLVSAIIEGALTAGATDIHLDPEDPEMRVRYRVDGVLHDVMNIPQEIEPAVISRIKIMADVDITETRHPQDGHISLQMGDRECDVRVATLPTFLGERVVLRLLDQSSVLSGISELGLDDNEEDALRKMVGEPYGMILVTGPTGSGKTTTLYAALNQKNVNTESIVTLEDPVEYQLSGINQVQIDSDIGLTFASTLRAALRQDIDVLLIGEIRDVETAQIAVRAAMTGHLVFSTLHTNDALEAISTLINMGIPSYLLASALTAIISQRLVKKICPHCKADFKPTKALLKTLGLPESVTKLYRGEGCDKCYHTGCRGRTGVFEILTITPRIRQMITENEGRQAILAESKLKLLSESCRTKVRLGIIPPEEYVRVIRA